MPGLSRTINTAHGGRHLQRLAMHPLWICQNKCDTKGVNSATLLVQFTITLEEAELGKLERTSYARVTY